MKLFFAIIPVILAQAPPVLLYNGAPPETANCAAKTRACDCHYASCTLAGVCACGWDDVSLTCKAGVTTKCVSCPAMHHCSVFEPLKIGANGFPVPGQMSVWAGAPYPDQSGTVGQKSAMPPPAAQPVQTQMPPAAQPQSQPPATTQPQTSSSTTQPQTPSDQPVGQPTQLYQDNPMSARACSGKIRPCDCHYASCTPTGDCICGWDTASKTCRAGVTTKCESCPAMHHCGVSEPLKIGPDGFPVPGQVESWGEVPYPDQSGKGKAGKGKAKGKAKGKNSNSTQVGQ